MSFDVTVDSGDTFRVVAASRDVLTWERALKGRSFGDLANSPTMEGIYGLAYAASRRQGLFVGSLQEFEQQADIDLVGEEDEEPDPTPPAPTAGSSSRSRSPAASRQASGRKKATARS